MGDATDILDRYFDMWNTTDPVVRSTLIQQVWTDDAEYVDPRSRVRGREQIEAMVRDFRQLMPTRSFRRIGEVQLHNEFAWYSWEMADGDGTPIGGGVSFAELRDGRLHRLVGFFGSG